MREQIAPISNNTTPSEKGSRIIVDFFVEHWEDPRYAGYAPAALTLKEQLDFVAQKVRNQEADLYEGKVDDITKIDLELRPLSDGDPYFATGAEREGTKALITMAYSVTGAESNPIYYSRDDANDYEVAILHGRHDGTDVYFMETRYQGFMTWELMSGVPEEFSRPRNAQAAEL